MASEEKKPNFVTLLITGIVGGALAGFFGVGGGIIMVPLLVSFSGLNQRSAQATSLLAIAPAALVGSASYGVGGIFPLVPALIVATGAVFGAQVGARVLRSMSSRWLTWSFVVFVAGMGLAAIATVPHRDQQLTLDLPVALGLVALGVLMGTAAGLFGVGGGIISIPLLMTVFGIGDLEAKGISLIAMAPAALSGSYAHLRHRTATIRDGLWVATGAIVVTPLGAVGAFGLHEEIANKVFGAFALAIALILALRASRKP